MGRACVGDEGLDLLVSALSPPPPLVELDLSLNRISSISAVTSLCSKVLRACAVLQRLNLGWNCLGREATSTFLKVGGR